MLASDIRSDFPILNSDFIYLDSAATSQKPVQVINAIVQYYEKYNANVHRSIYSLAQEATDLYENSRKKVADFIGAKNEEIVFTRNTTESINMLSHILSKGFKKGEKILLTRMEHHSNLLPWLRLREKGVIVEFVDIRKDGTLDLEDFKSKIGKDVKIVSMTHVSNVLGTVNDINEFGKIAKEFGSYFIVDGAQSIPHIPFKVNDYIDFVAFSGHKMLGPMGIGCLYGKYEILQSLDPFMEGGEMVRNVSYEEIQYEDPPVKFEAGTPNVEGAVGLGAAVDYLSSLGMENVRNHERKLTKLALELSNENPKIEFYGPNDPDLRSGLISFNVKSKNYENVMKGLKSRGIVTGKFIHPHDVAGILNAKYVFTRSGYHCAEPLFKFLGVNGGVRFSWYVYNTEDELVKSFEVLGDISV